MYKIIAIIFISIAASSCSLQKSKIETVKAEKATEEKPKREKPAIKKAAIGDAVIARWGPALWAEGRVGSFNESGSEARVVWADESESPSFVDVVDIFPSPKPGDPVPVEPGDYTLVKGGTDEWWTAAQVREVNGSVVKAKMINGGEIVNIPAEKVLTVSEAVTADIKDQADRQACMDKAHEHRPIAPTGYTPKVGDRILGEWTTHAWYGGKIKSISGDAAVIVWENGMTPDDAPFEKIIPFPTVADASVAHGVGDFVLVRPSNGNPKAAWLYAQVTAVNGAGIEARSDDATRDYKAGDYVVLGK